jgi:S1-C subfamily serine protease
LQALSDGYQLEVLTPTDSRKLDLSGSENALAMVRKCVASIDEGNDPSTLGRTTRSAERPPDASPPPGPQTVTGAAFLISDRYFLTNAHVAGSCLSLGVAQPGRGDWISATLMASDATNDLALIRAENWTGSTSAPIFRGQVRLGEAIAVFGYPYGGAITASGSFTQCSISSLTGLANDSSRPTITAPIQPGNSGGPVLDQSGRVVGVVVAKLDALAIAEATGDVPEGVNFAIKASTAASFLEANGLTPHGGEENSAFTLSAPDLADMAASLTVMVRCEK